MRAVFSRIVSIIASKHVKALFAVCNDRVLLAVGAQADALLELIHRINVIHPLRIDVLQQHHALHFTHDRRGERLLTQVVKLVRTLLEKIDDRLLLEILKRLTLIVQLTGLTIQPR